tara:strand:+ start:44879 stop:46381 length:1503 start_codon:yes stop_codon:yes gene_type:complete
MERFRFAPSPTGPLHIGGLRTALFNYLFAKNTKGEVILRIEDTDKNRYVEGSEKHIIESLKWLNINFDEGPGIGGKYGPYRQSERIDLYKTYIEELIYKEKAYYAFDTNEDLMNERRKEEEKGSTFFYGQHNRLSLKNSLSLKSSEVSNLIENKTPYVIRLLVSTDKNVLCNDMLRGNINFDSTVLEDKILLKSDGAPTYHFANVVDDHLMNISTVVRGEEWLSSLPIHYLIYAAFDWTTPNFLHLPLILNPKGKGKLSKRDGDRYGFPVFAINWNENLSQNNGFKEAGFAPISLLNYLTQLGGSFKNHEGIHSFNDFIDAFDIKKISKGGSKFDYEKAKWINSKYIQNVDVKDLLSIINSETKRKLESLYPDKINYIYKLVKNRMVLLNDDEKILSFLITTPTNYSLEVYRKIKLENAIEVMTSAVEIINKVSVSSFKNSLMLYVKERGVKLGSLLRSIRFALVGNLTGPDLFDIIKLLDKKECIKRLNNYIEYLKNLS